MKPYQEIPVHWWEFIDSYLEWQWQGQSGKWYCKDCKTVVWPRGVDHQQIREILMPHVIAHDPPRYTYWILTGQTE